MKAKFNLSSITGVVTQHVEKVVLALACVLALVLVWGGIATSGGLDWDPAKLVSESTGAENNIDSGEVGPDDTIDWKKKAVVLVEELKLAKKPIPNTPYDHPHDWAQGLFDERSKRGVPPLFALEELRATAGRGAVRMVAKAAAREPRATRGGTLGQRWIVLTGAIPFAKQLDAYRVAFRDSYQDPAKDVPSYIYYRVERAEVGPSGDAAELQWTRLNVGYRGGALAVTQQWTGRQAEIVAAPFLARTVDIPMAFPLPPVTNRQWGPEIAHEPDIPFYHEARLTRPMSEDQPEVETPDEPGTDEPGGFRGRPDAAMTRGMPGMDEVGMGSGMMNMDMGAGPGMRLGDEPVAVRLFRFFDFSVAPGKSYRYRVRLLLANPNQDVPPEYLAEAELRNVKYLETEFCDPTDAVTIPLDARLLCVSVKSSLNAAVEPSSRMMSIRFDPETGEETAVEHEKLYRGQLANFFGIPVETAPERGLGTMMMPGEGGMDMMDMMPGGTEGERKPAKGRRTKRGKKSDEEEIELVDHLTQHIVLDFQGGQRMGRELTRPSSILLLNASGQLVIRSDLDDLEEYLTYHVPEEKPRKKTEGDEAGGMDDMMMLMGEGTRK